MAVSATQPKQQKSTCTHTPHQHNHICVHPAKRMEQQTKKKRKKNQKILLRYIHFLPFFHRNDSHPFHSFTWYHQRTPNEKRARGDKRLEHRKKNTQKNERKKLRHFSRTNFERIIVTETKYYMYMEICIFFCVIIFPSLSLCLAHTHNRSPISLDWKCFYQSLFDFQTQKYQKRIHFYVTKLIVPHGERRNEQKNRTKREKIINAEQRNMK